MLEIIFYLFGCFVLYMIIRLAVDHSNSSYYAKKNHEILTEILDLLKQNEDKKSVKEQ